MDGPWRGGDAVQAAVDEYERAPTPQRRAVREAAFREYVRRLPYVIGNAEASRYEASWVGYQEATERVEQLAVRLGLLPSTDATDRQLQQQLIDAQAAAGKAFGVATVALEAALDRARTHDEKGGREWPTVSARSIGAANFSVRRGTDFVYKKTAV